MTLYLNKKKSINNCFKIKELMSTSLKTFAYEIALHGRDIPDITLKL